MALDTNSPLSTELLSLLVCPETGQPLAPASPELLARLSVPLQAGLVREDGKAVYPIHDGLPSLLIQEAIQVSASP